jgi:light-harvesting protein B-800-850 alpha chain
MNQGKLWTVVNPSVGLPLLLGSVAVTAILVHVAILSNTTWYPAFFSGKTQAAVAAPAAPAAAKK